MIKEPDPEEQEEALQEPEIKDEKAITESIYNGIIQQQFELEQNNQFNV